ncbi:MULTISPECIES: hypothetical protein [unclassified Streptomyces]|uniref:hypothetical protein n=1 Tax=unclassified Streptomyces TaxID=2593676 RepID=UPI0037FF8BB5
MASTATRTPPDLPARLADARTETEKVRGELSQAEQDLAAALEREDFRAAEDAKSRVEAIRPHLALAEASQRALADAMTALDAHRQAEQAAAQRQALQEAAQRTLEAAMAAEREAEETAHRCMAEVAAGLEAIRASLMAAKQAEQVGGTARRNANTAQAELAGTPPIPYISTPNWASARIARSPVLTAILRSDA